MCALPFGFQHHDPAVQFGDPLVGLRQDVTQHAVLRRGAQLFGDFGGAQHRPFALSDGGVCGLPGVFEPEKQLRVFFHAVPFRDTSTIERTGRAHLQFVRRTLCESIHHDRRITVGLFNKPKDISPAALADVPEETTSKAQSKARPTPSRREAEAARMAKLHPELNPKQAKKIDRAANANTRLKQLEAYEDDPRRRLMRDVVDSRFNLGEIALPAMMLLLVVSFIPQAMEHRDLILAGMWGIIAVLVIDTVAMWRTYKKVAAERLSGTPMKGVLHYGWSRQMSFRAWRRPAPRLKRGEKY